MRGFHGRTFGALSATWEKKYRSPFEPLVPGYKHFPYNDLEALEKTITDQTAAVLLEVIQGEGGVNPGKAEFLQGAQEICRKNGALLILDEVQTGFGRTGKMFAYQHFNLQPDILCVAKSIAGGIPMGATLLSSILERIAAPGAWVDIWWKSACLCSFTGCHQFHGRESPARTGGRTGHLVQRTTFHHPITFDPRSTRPGFDGWH